MRVDINRNDVLCNLLNWKKKDGKKEFICFNTLSCGTKLFFKNIPSPHKFSYAFSYPDGEKAIVYISRGIVIYMVKTENVSEDKVFKSLSEISNTIKNGGPNIHNKILQRMAG